MNLHDKEMETKKVIFRSMANRYDFNDLDSFCTWDDYEGKYRLRVYSYEQGVIDGVCKTIDSYEKAINFEDNMKVFIHNIIEAMATAS